MNAKPLILAALVAVLYILHQDFFLWRAVHPLAFGFLPVGLFYHAIYTLGCAALMALLCRYAWPAHLEGDAAQGGDDR